MHALLPTWEHNTLLKYILILRVNSSMKIYDNLNSGKILQKKCSKISRNFTNHIDLENSPSSSDFKQYST